MSPSATPAPLLDAEKLDCYRVACELHVLVAAFTGLGHVLRDQLERASLSVVLNVAEGAGRRSSADKARFYAMARGSAAEVAAAVDVASLRALAPAAACRQARGLAVRVVQMLTRLDAAVSLRPQ